MAKQRAISYLRVSTARQGRSGLGLEAQRSAVADYLRTNPHQLVSEFVEVESGGNDARPRLQEALALCRAHRAVLIVAKLDRLARDAHFLLGLQKAGVDFVAVDMPHANRLTVGIMALMAEEERRLISVRTKAALAAAKKRGVKLGGFRGRAGTSKDTAKARAARTAAAAELAADLAPIFARLDPAGDATLSAMAADLNAEGIPTPSGCGAWTATTVRRIRHRLAAG